MVPRILIMLVLSGILLAACGGAKTTGGEAYPAPTNIPASSDVNVRPYPVDENNRPIVVNPEGASPYPAPDNLERGAEGTG